MSRLYFIVTTPGNAAQGGYVTRFQIAAANVLYTERPELAGVDIAGDVLDAVTWGA